MADLERRLRALAPDAFPPAPDVAAAVAARIAAGESRRATSARDERVATRGGRVTRPVRGRGPLAGRRPALALLLALVLVPGAAVAAVPAARNAVLDWLGLASVRVERVPRLPDLPALDRLDLGERVASPAAAGRRAGFSVALPRGLGAPDGVYVSGDGIVSLAYESVPGLPRDAQTGLGLLVTQVRAQSRPEFLVKMAGPGTRVDAVSVAGAPGVFLSGSPHGVTIERPGGVLRELRPRLAGNTLVFERGGLVIRLEGGFGRDRALALARNLAP